MQAGEACLGVWVSSTGSDLEDRRKLSMSWNKAFWQNAKLFNNPFASQTSKLKFWRRISNSIGDYYFAGMRPCKKHGCDLESFHNKILCRILKLRPSADETAELFVRRRNRTVRQCKDSSDIDVRRRWSLRIVSWVEHLFRHQETLGFKFLSVQDDLWLQTCRILANSGSELAGHTRARSGPGKPLRWSTGWLEKVGSVELEDVGCGWENPGRSQQVTRRRADVLHFEVFCNASEQVE